MVHRVFIALAIAAGLAGAQEEKRVCCGMAGALPWAGYNRNIVWQPDLDTAFRIAGETGKPVLFFDLVGDLDKEGC